MRGRQCGQFVDITSSPGSIAGPRALDAVPPPTGRRIIKTKQVSSSAGHG